MKCKCQIIRTGYNDIKRQSSRGKEKGKKSLGSQWNAKQDWGEKCIRFEGDGWVSMVLVGNVESKRCMKREMPFK